MLPPCPTPIARIEGRRSCGSKASDGASRKAWPERADAGESQDHRAREILVYNVHMFKYLKVAEARARFGEILDEAENGTPVVIERRGVRFRLVAEPAAPSRMSRK